ncbi:SRPBCC family protein [Natronorubrum halophilum]|uniref:SRPBCC family protein n=1 Tax=Natronorubrum halophilum TaxID=1702106 RepID=UPI000EF65E69|nr:SRPBCC family protein [Natronorubrum halophilum]
MREVTVSRVVDASPVVVSRWLDPPTIVEAEGSFTVETIDERADATIVVVSGPGMQLPLRFEDRDEAMYYTQEGEQGPFSHMETWLEVDDADGGNGTRVTIRSSISLAAPLPFGDRIAAWKRTGELKRVLEALEDEFG